MSGPPPGLLRDVSGFRIRILLATMLVIAGLTAVGVFVTQRHLSAIAARELEASIDQQIAAADQKRQLRHTVLSEICDRLARQSRIRAALEDDALDLLYPSARDELRQLMQVRPAASHVEANDELLQARFYRFLDINGRLILPAHATSAGRIDPSLEEKLELPMAPATEQIGYFVKSTPDDGPAAVEVFAIPIIASERLEVIAALVVGFPIEVDRDVRPGHALRRGLWIEEQLIVSGFDTPARRLLAQAIKDSLRADATASSSDEIALQGVPHRIDLRPMNEGSLYPPADEVFVASLAELVVQQERMRAQILTGAGVLFLLGLGLSHLMSRRLARPVEALAEASEEEHEQRMRAEEALDQTSRELERAARFSADASHQLKTPVAVMRAGLEELLATPELPDTLRTEVNDLVGQTGRLSTVIEDLLLLSRLDAGRLQLNLQPENFRLLVDSLLDDFSILPDHHQVSLAVDVARELTVEADRRYAALILQNLLENAHKYNRPGGRIRIVAKQDGEFVSCRMGNTGAPIHESAQRDIFERFHRGQSGENVPGYGLGLNLAHELARLHHGELRLLRSHDDWTEFELRLRSAPTPDSETDAPT